MYAKTIKNPIAIKVEKVINSESSNYIRATKFADIRNKRALTEALERHGYEPHYHNYSVAGFKKVGTVRSAPSRDADERLGGKTTMQVTIDTLLSTGEASSEYLPIKKATLSYNVAELRKKGWNIKTINRPLKASIYKVIKTPEQKKEDAPAFDSIMPYKKVLEWLDEKGFIDNRSLTDEQRRKLSNAIYKIKAKGYHVEAQMFGNGFDRYTIYKLIK